MVARAAGTEALFDTPFGDDCHASMPELSQIVGDQFGRAAEVETRARSETAAIRSVHADAGQALNAVHLAEFRRQADPQKNEGPDAATYQRSSTG